MPLVRKRALLASGKKAIPPSKKAKKSYHFMGNIGFKEDRYHALYRTIPYTIDETSRHIGKNIVALLNGGGGILVYGVRPNGIIYGEDISRKEMDVLTNNTIDRAVKKIIPNLGVDKYNLTFPEVEENSSKPPRRLLMIKVADGGYELYEDELHNAYRRTDNGSIYGPLTPHEIKDICIEKEKERISNERKLADLMEVSSPKRSAACGKNKQKPGEGHKTLAQRALSTAKSVRSRLRSTAKMVKTQLQDVISSAGSTSGESDLEMPLPSIASKATDVATKLAVSKLPLPISSNDPKPAVSKPPPPKPDVSKPPPPRPDVSKPPPPKPDVSKPPPPKPDVSKPPPPKPDVSKPPPPKPDVSKPPPPKPAVSKPPPPRPDVSKPPPPKPEVSKPPPPRPDVSKPPPPKPDDAKLPLTKSKPTKPKSKSPSPKPSSSKSKPQLDDAKSKSKPHDVKPEVSKPKVDVAKVPLCQTKTAKTQDAYKALPKAAAKSLKAEVPQVPKVAVVSLYPVTKPATKPATIKIPPPTKPRAPSPPHCKPLNCNVTRQDYYAKPVSYAKPAPLERHGRHFPDPPPAPPPSLVQYTTCLSNPPPPSVPLVQNTASLSHLPPHYAAKPPPYYPPQQQQQQQPPRHQPPPQYYEHHSNRPPPSYQQANHPHSQQLYQQLYQQARSQQQANHPHSQQLYQQANHPHSQQLYRQAHRQQQLYQQQSYPNWRY